MDRKSSELLWILNHNSPKKVVRIKQFLGDNKLAKIRRKFNTIVVTDDEGLSQRYTLDPFEFLVLRA